MANFFPQEQPDTPTSPNTPDIPVTSNTEIDRGSLISSLANRIRGLTDVINERLASSGLNPVDPGMIDKLVNDNLDQFITDGAIQQIEPPQLGDYVFDFNVSYKPQLRLVETPYAIFNAVKIFESPPVAPIPFIYPLIGKSDRFVISVMPSSGEVTDFPISILPEDTDYFSNVLVSQKSSDGKVHFQQEGETTGFQVFKLDTHPEEYTQFKLYKTLDFPYGNSFTEFVETNVPQYYCFRSIDVHGSVSNPTEIYKIQIIENSGVFYPVIQIVELLKPKLTVPAISFKKFIKVMPSISQIMYSESDEKIGVLDESIFERKFRLRFSSKHTQKKFDVILTFNKNVLVEE